MDDKNEPGPLDSFPPPEDSVAEAVAQLSELAPHALAPPPPRLLEPVQPPLRLSITIICTILFLFLIGAQILGTWTTDREDMLEAPEEFLERVEGRNLDMEEFAEHRSEPEKLLDWLEGYNPGDMLDQAISAYDEFLGKAKSDWARLYRTLVILFAEAQRLDEASDALETLASLDLDPADRDFVAACQIVYFPTPAPVVCDRLSAGTIGALVHPAWARDRFILRIAQKQGDDATAVAARQRLDSRAKKLHDQALPLVWTPVVTIGGGLLALIFWLGRGLPPFQVGNGLAASPWRPWRGAAALVRAALGGLAISQLIASVLTLWPQFAFLRGFASLLAILPLLWIGTHKLLRPWGHTISSCFGLSVPASRWGVMLLFTLALAGADQLGSVAISVLLDKFGIRMHWAESPQEDYLWMPWWQVSLDFLDGIVWAPIFEEIGCRGFLYTTIRRRFHALPAALLTGLIFGAVHFYSLSGFLSVAWSGFVWSLAYEKSRSLIPGMISHSLGNVMAFGGMVLLYRI